MELAVNDHVMAIGHLAPDYIILDRPIDHPPASGEIFMSIDGHESRWPVRLPAGISSANPRTPISAPVAP
jgi:hypothetical protein